MEKLNRILSLLEGIRSEIDHSKNKSKSKEVREHYLNNAKLFTHYIEDILKGEE